MKINFKNYTDEYGFNDDFLKVFEFFKKYGAIGMYENWHWGRWEWLIGHANLEKYMLPIIGIWEYHGSVVAVATHDMRLGKDVVHEAINRCSARGAKVAQVISNQQFYYSIGFEMSSAYTFWEKKII